MSLDLDPHRARLLERVLPAYEQLGTLAFAYWQGSLVSGYTDQSDLDVILVWDTPDAPTGREGVVATLDEEGRQPPFVVDYMDVHLDRFVMAQQEYNVGHWSLPASRDAVQTVLTGRERPGPGVLHALTAVSGFWSGQLLFDPAQEGVALHRALRAFPLVLQEQSIHVVRNHRAAYLADVRKFAERRDWFMFHSVLVTAVRASLQALFAAHRVYYPGDKWLREAIRKHGLGQGTLAAFDGVWDLRAPATERIASLTQLLDLALDSGAPTASR